MSAPMIKVNKTCDSCRHRKIRCIVADNTPGKPTTCIYCEKRNEPCHFSVFRRRKVAPPPYAPAISSLSQQPLQIEDGELLIDRIIQQGCQELAPVTPRGASVIKVSQEELATCPPVAYFSDQKIRTLCDKIGGLRLQTVIERLEETIVARTKGTDNLPWDRIAFSKPSKSPELTASESKLYIDAYFKHLHPAYPFLEKSDFEPKPSDRNLSELLAENPAFSALYHAVLALGSQYILGPPFRPGCSKTWDIFAVSLGHMNDLILPNPSLENVQALIAMSIFSLNASCLMLEDNMIWQAAVAAIAFRAHRSGINVQAARTFWVIYALEKQLCLELHAGSLIADHDVGCVIPRTPDAIFGTFNSFESTIRCARISSIAYQTLMSNSAPLANVETRLGAVDKVRRQVEEWRLWVPSQFRPGYVPRLSDFPENSAKLVLLQTHFWYHTLTIMLERLTLHLDTRGGERCQKSRQSLMNAARSIAEMTHFIGMDVHMPICIMGVTPMAAMFILFEFVIHNPRHHETRSNLAALDSLAGYFSLVEYASKGALAPAGSSIAELADIAREYYCKIQQADTDSALAARQALMNASSATHGTSNGGASNTAAAVNLGNETTQRPPSNSLGEIEVDSALTDPSSSESTSGNPDYLSYPTPHNFGAASDIQIFDSVEFNKSIFGWMAPDWMEADFSYGPMDFANQGQMNKGDEQ